MNLTLIQKILSRLQKFLKKKIARANIHESFYNHIKMSTFYFLTDLILYFSLVIYKHRTRKKCPEIKDMGNASLHDELKAFFNEFQQQLLSYIPKHSN